jgi:hypothetical protein
MSNDNSIIKELQEKEKETAAVAQTKAELLAALDKEFATSTT